MHKCLEMTGWGEGLCEEAMLSEVMGISMCCGGTFGGKCAPSWKLQAMLVFRLALQGHGLHMQKMNTSQEESNFS